MSTFLTVLAIYLGPSALVIAWVAADRYFDNRAESKHRAEQEREVTPEWLAILAATEPTPIYDALVCERIEKAEGWAS